MLRTLPSKLSAALLLLLFLTAALCVLLTLNTTQQYQAEANQRQNRTLAEHVAEHLADKNILRSDPRSRKRAMAEIKRLMVINPSVEVYLLDKQGTILAYSAAPGKVVQTKVAVEPLQALLHGDDPLPHLGDDPREPGKRKIFSVASVPVKAYKQNKQLEGFVYIILDGQQHRSLVQAVQRSHILRLSLLMTIGIFVCALLVGLGLFQLITRRLRQLTRDIEGFERHAAETAAPSEGALTAAADGDEIERLRSVFAAMTARIEAQVTQLKRADVYRREMVSNVSHDLRTPLAALHGYLETLVMKADVLTPEEQHHYLMVAARHSNRLGKLVSELFDLGRLDAREVQAHAEPFALGELVQDVAQKFQLTAQSRDLRLVTKFPHDLPFVCADLGLIERVLENLIDNALRYTPAGGIVTLVLALAGSGQHILVQVQDTGRGITAEDVEHIFERYYRTSEGSPRQEPGHAGLGLAITKRILELHASTISVSSVYGGESSGTTFSFPLPLWCPPDTAQSNTTASA